MYKAATFIALMFINMTSNAVLPNDQIQRCLDVRRLADLSIREKMAAQEPAGLLPFKFHKVPSSELPLGHIAANMDEIIKALTIQIQNCKKTHAEYPVVTIAGRKVMRQQWCLDTNQKMLALAQSSHGDTKKYFSAIQNQFDWYKSEGWPLNHSGFKKGEFQFTAYYAPAGVEARSKKEGEFIHPVYSNPGVVNMELEAKQYHLKTPLCGIDPVSKMMRKFCMKNAEDQYSIAPDREEISRGILDSKYIIGYVSDPNTPAFLMLQGSGSMVIDGKLYHVNYDGANGLPRTMLGRIVQCAQDPTCGGNLDIIEKCAKDPKCHDDKKLRCNLSEKIRLSGASETQIRQFLQHPMNQAKALDLRNRDQSFVFFAKEEGGPYGSEKIQLTPHVSCATDHRVIPVGMNFIYSHKDTTSWCVAQDAGGAIIGAHVDIYKGEGVLAGKEANAVNDKGSLYIALPKHTN